MQPSIIRQITITGNLFVLKTKLFMVPNFVYVPVNYALTCDCISAFVKNSPQDQHGHHLEGSVLNTEVPGSLVKNFRPPTNRVSLHNSTPKVSTYYNPQRRCLVLVNALTFTAKAVNF